VNVSGSMVAGLLTSRILGRLNTEAYLGAGTGGTGASAEV